jgi:hypothetical protein
VVSFPRVSPPTPCISLSSLPYALYVCPAHLILLGFITRTILGEAEPLEHPVSLLRPNVSLKIKRKFKKAAVRVRECSELRGFKRKMRGRKLRNGVYWPKKA